MSHLSDFEIENDELKFSVKNIDKSLLNALRRIMISEVPTLGFKSENGKEIDINIIENTSSLHNEFLSHRLSLIPIVYDYNSIENYDRNKYKFIIDETNKTTKMMDITTGHIKIQDLTTEKFLSRKECDKFFPPIKLQMIIY